MSSLLAEVLEAHGGFEKWQHFSRVQADAVTGGGLFPLKGLMPDPSTRRMTVWVKEERASVAPFGAAGVDVVHAGTSVDRKAGRRGRCGMGLSTECLHSKRLE